MVLVDGGQLLKHAVITIKGALLAASLSALVAGVATLTTACSAPRDESRMSGMMGMGMNGGMKKMMRGMMGGMLPPGVAAKDLPEPESNGARLVSRFCGQCHDLPSPAMHTTDEWTLVADRMFKRMAMMAGMGGMGNMMDVEAPSEGERDEILAYLGSHSLKPYGSVLIPEPGTAGAALFSRTCSQCHALPDIALHKSGEWPDVVERMRLNMRTMGRREITDKEAGEIAGYLSRHARN
ncbi:MAG: cytochrome c [Nitrospinae bacterium]|nr:cytochrome c [Nitrospinota bacterium]